MRVVNRGNQSTRIVFAEEADGEFIVSPFATVQNGRRPIARFDTKEELEAYASAKHCEVKWQAA